jgi:catalase
VTNIVGHASDHVTDEVQLRVIAYWSAVDADLGGRIAEGLGQDTGTVGYKNASAVVESRANMA